ncbi:hypothetical protein FTO68_11165 [Methanocalculus taiwanensis]|uniref:Carbamoyltransferase n=1 Tax=Methanocalculus taiwanensis TaxID=106207 RepID=A0ABD4TL99_9EURY|nr:carbamoyltransferase C-terminal domain-containing protein [Methanocalculus taiwanensis]MCQ1539536.1 hypothetical protein [Methanocalculus taiwanensis]
MKVIGIHDGHNASACLIDDGKIVYCIQEERLTNKKNFYGFPEKSLKEILRITNLEIKNIDKFAYASNHTAIGDGDVLRSYKQSLSLKSRMLDLGVKTPLYSFYKNKIKKIRIKNLVDLGVNHNNITFVEHHLCHAATAYFGSPWWKTEDILILTNDGSGDDLCATVSVGDSGSIKRIAETPKGNSIGNIYSRTVFLLGLVPWEHEWKIMGMAPYAPIKGVQQSYSKFKQYLTINNEELTFSRNISEPTHWIYPRLRRDLEFHRFDWISGGVQEMTEDLLCRWVTNAVSKTGIRKVALSGGVFMNVKANKRIMELDCVDDIFVFPSCGDESNSIGAAFWAYAELCKKYGEDNNIESIRDIYYGNSFTEQEIRRLLDQKGKMYNFKYFNNIESEIAQIIAEGGVVARCKDRMEFGARALGNRSILADPSNQSCIRTINMMVKKRDFWMPFAPVILKERVSEYIINPKNVESPYMMLSFDTTDKREDFMAGVHQADLTARAQILEKEWNSGYYKVLQEFENITERGVLLNTSFNLHGYPMVNGPEEALWVFENSGLEYLALGDFIVSK